MSLPYAVAYQMNTAGDPVPLGWLANFDTDGQDGLVGFHFDTYDATKPLVLQFGGLPPAGRRRSQTYGGVRSSDQSMVVGRRSS